MTINETIKPGLRESEGKSEAAARRRAAARQKQGKLHTGKPGDTIKIGSVEYFVARDGSFRRQA